MGLGVALMAAQLSLAVPDCPIDRTVYRLHEAPEFQAGFARTLHPYDLSSDLRFFLKTPKRTFWFALSVSQGHSALRIVPTFNPHHDPSDDPAPEPRDDAEQPPAIAFASFGPDLAIWNKVPQSTDRPPARLFSAELDQQLYYNTVALADGDAAAEQEEMPEGMFEPAGCAASPH